MPRIIDPTRRAYEVALAAARRDLRVANAALRAHDLDLKAHPYDRSPLDCRLARDATQAIHDALRHLAAAVHVAGQQPEPATESRQLR